MTPGSKVKLGRGYVPWLREALGVVTSRKSKHGHWIRLDTPVLHPDRHHTWADPVTGCWATASTVEMLDQMVLL